MPCFDFVKGRPGKSMPPKKSHSWRSRNTTLPELPTHNSVVNYKDLTPEFGENRPLNMGPNSVQSDLQNNGHRYEAVSPPNNQIDDMPLDFSVKPDRNCRPQDRTASPQFGQPINVKSLDYVSITPNGERNGSTMVHFPNGMNFHFNSKTQNFKIDQTPVKIKVSPGRKGSADYFDAINLDHSQMGAKFSNTQRTKSPSPHLQSPNSSSKSPILAGMLAGSPQQLPTVEMLNSRMIPFGLPNGYPNGFNAMYVPGGIQNPNPVMANPNIYNSNIIAAPSLAYMQSQMLPPVAQIPLQSKADHKPVRKGKQERPFKNYDVSLQNDLQCNTLPWPVIPAINSRAIDDSNQSDALRPGSVTASSPTRADPVNGNSENSSQSDAPSAVSEMDNTPHSSMPNNALEEGAETDKNNRGRKRKPVADSEKDASYWERRKKNNQAAKRSRENRRIKEDTVAQQAVYFRGEVNNLTHALMAQRAQIQDYEMKILSLQKDKLALTADIAVCKQALSQRRCGECGNPLGNML